MSTQLAPTGNILILKLRKKNSGRFAHTIYQEDLEELLLKRRRVREAEKELKQKEEFIAAALRSGASVEDGVHTADLVPVDRAAFRAKACTYYRLSVI